MTDSGGKRTRKQRFLMVVVYKVVEVMVEREEEELLFQI